MVNKMIKIYNRRTKIYEIEKVANKGWLNSLYGTSKGRFWLELLIKRKICSFLYGKLYNSRISARRIAGFIKQYDIDMSECVNEVNDFKSFNDFFIRKLKPEARKFETKTNLLLSPGDGRMRAWNDIDIKSMVQIKGFSYTLDGLLSDKELAQKYDGGICIVLRLAPVDYHRFYFVDSGICSSSWPIKGFYHSVNPKALNTIPELFCRNRREVSLLRSDNFKDITYAEVGSSLVGSIVQTYKPETEVARGGEKGYFQFGGSTVILFLEKDTAAVDEDILLQTEIGYEVKVLAGEVIGRAKK